MTPSLASVYDALVSLAATDRFADLVLPLREEFVRRVGVFAPTDAWFEERSAALWDRVLTDQAVIERMRATRPPSFERDHFAALDGLAHAQRGLFELHAQHDAVDVTCWVTGAAFRLAPSDDAARALALGGEIAPGVIDALVAPMGEGVAILPGLLVHAPEATDPIRLVLARAEELALEKDALLDALLSMRHRHAALSRMKARQVYRAELLG